MDKIKQNRHGGVGERKRGEELPPRFVKHRFFFIYLLIYFIYFSNFTVGWNYVMLYFSSCFWFTSGTQNRMEINL